MNKYFYLVIAIVGIWGCNDDPKEPEVSCENCIQFTDPKGVKRTFIVYSKELAENTVYRDSNGNGVPKGLLKLYASENPNSIIGMTFYVNQSYDFKRNYTASGKVDFLPGGSIRSGYDKAIVVFWDGNPNGTGLLAIKSDVEIDDYSYSKDVYDQHIMKGKMSKLYFERSDSTKTIPSFGVSKAELNDVLINIKY
ncbi:MAG: hypothetical protein H6607_05755 [Flavobacteriales bacterium]|nr:hypothetical protein [Flavobacteriales bacterium]